MNDRFVFGGRTYEYAGFGRRVGAATLDSLVWIIGIGTYVPGAAFEGPAGAILSIVLLSAWFNYFAICEWRWGRTIGKNMLGIRVMPVDGGRLEFGPASLRNLLRLVDGPLTLLMILPVLVDRSPRRQRLGDRAAGTIVVRELKPETAPAAAPPPPPVPTSGELFGEATGVLAAAEPGPGAAPAPVETGAGRPAAPPPEPSPPRQGRSLPYADWPVGRTVRAVIAGILLGGLLLPVPVLIADPELDSHAARIGVQAILGLTLIATALIAAGLFERGAGAALERLGVRRFPPSALGWAALAYFGYLFMLVAYSALVDTSQEDVARDLGLDAGTVTALFSVLLIAVVAPISEELFFRGLLYGGLRTRMAPVAAAAISGLVFGALHATTGVSAVPPLAVFGFVLALLYERTGSLWPPILLHCINNSIALAAAS